jgi:hypothetical protein
MDSQNSQHAVAHEPGQETVVLSDDLIAAGAVAIEYPHQFFGVKPYGHSDRIDQIAEQHRHRPALCPYRRRLPGRSADRAQGPAAGYAGSGVRPMPATAR